MNKQINESVEIIDLTNETTTKHNTTITLDDSIVKCGSESPELAKIDEDVEIFQDFPPEPSPPSYASVQSSPNQNPLDEPSQQVSQPKRPPTPIFSSSPSTSPSELTPPNTPPSSQSNTPINQSSSTSRSFESASSDSKNPKTTKAYLKELRKREREQSRQERLKLKEQEKLMREANRANAASRALDNCVARIDKEVLTVIGDQDEVALRTLFDESMIRYELVNSPKIDKSITWDYKRIEINDGKCEEVHWISEWTMVVLTGEDYLKRLITYRDEPTEQTSLKNFLLTIRQTSTSDLIVVVYNLSGFLKAERVREAKNYKKTFQDRYEKNKSKNQDGTCPPVVTNIGLTDLQELRLRLELEMKHEYTDWKLHFEFQEKTNDVVQLFARYTSSVAKLEIKRRTKTSTGIDWAINVDKERAVDPCKSTEDLTKLWIAQLQQFTQITLPIAKAIAAEYPSPCALLDQYSSLTLSEGENLLAELYVQRNLKRQIGQSISKRIYKFMTCEDPDAHIGLS